MRSHQIGLQLLELIGWDLHLGELSETGVDPVGGLSDGDDIPDGGRRGAYLRFPCGRQHNGVEARDNSATLGQGELSRKAGRASWRERVCQGVETRGVAGS